MSNGELFKPKDPYLIIKPLSQGGFGDVYLATNKTTQQAVAIKRLHPHLYFDSHYRTKLLNEQNILSAIKHPHIANLHEAVDADEEFYLILDYIEGESLETLIQQSTQETQAVKLIGQLKTIIDDLQKNGILHGDIHPLNVIISNHQTYLIDFTSAQRLLPQQSEYRFLGAPKDYQLKEQKLEKTITQYHDYKMLGFLLLEMLLGKKLFAANTNIEIFVKAHEFDFEKTLAATNCSKSTYQFAMELFFKGES